MFITWWYFGGIFLETVNLGDFVFTISYVIFQGQTISQAWLARFMQNHKGSASVGYWVIYVILTFGLTDNLDLIFSRLNFGKVLSK